MTSKWYFGCDSDQHYCYRDLKKPPELSNPDKGENLVNHILELHKKYVLDLLLCPGDTTDYGADESKPCRYCCCSDKHGNEYEAFMDNYYTPLTASGINLYLCPGNHDVDGGYPGKSLLKFINKQYSGTYTSDRHTSANYKFEHKGFYFICMGVYPKNTEWLKKKSTPQQINTGYYFLSFQYSSR